MELHDDIIKGQVDDILHMASVTGNDELIQKAFFQMIEKGNPAIVGETREWNGVRFRKEDSGKWVEGDEIKLEGIK